MDLSEYKIFSINPSYSFLIEYEQSNEDLLFLRI